MKPNLWVIAAAQPKFRQALANHRDATASPAKVDPARAGRKDARAALAQPAYWRRHWPAMPAACKPQLKRA